MNAALTKDWHWCFGRNACYGAIDKTVKHHVTKNKHCFGLHRADKLCSVGNVNVHIIKFTFTVAYEWSGRLLRLITADMAIAGCRIMANIERTARRGNGVAGNIGGDGTARPNDSAGANADRCNKCCV